MAKHIDLGHHPDIPNKQGVKEVYRLKEENNDLIEAFSKGEERLKQLDIEIAYPSPDPIFYKWLLESKSWDLIPIFEWKDGDNHLKVLLAYLYYATPQYIMGEGLYNIPIYSFYIGFVPAKISEIKADYFFILRTEISAVEYYTASLKLLYPNRCSLESIMQGDIKRIRTIDRYQRYLEIPEDSERIQKYCEDIIDCSIKVDGIISRYYVSLMVKEKDLELQKVFTGNHDPIDESDLGLVVEAMKKETPYNIDFYIAKLDHYLKNKYPYEIEDIHLDPETGELYLLWADLRSMDHLLDYLSYKTTSDRVKNILNNMQNPYKGGLLSFFQGDLHDVTLEQRKNLGQIKFLFNGKWVEQTLEHTTESTEFWQKYKYNLYYMIKISNTIAKEYRFSKKGV